MGNRNFEQVGGNKIFRPWGHWTEGDEITGKFVGTSEDNFDNTNFEIEVEECQFEEEVIHTKTKKGDKQELHAPKEGEIFVLNSCGSLEKAMEKCDIGDFIKVIYTGTTTLTKGKFAGKQAHTMKVLRAAGKPKAPVAQAEDEDTDVL